MLRRFLPFLLLFALFPACAAAQPALKRALGRAIAGAGPASGAYVIDGTTHKAIFSWRPDTPRTLASNTKIFTSAAALGFNGATSTLATDLLGNGSLQPDGTWQGDLYLRGGGDPTFGGRSFAQRFFGSDASVDALAAQLEQAGFTSVTGSVFGDESLFDSVRGTAYSGFGVSTDIGGPLSALDFDRGLANSSGSAFQAKPPQFAAARLRAVLESDGIHVTGKPKAGAAPAGSVVLAEARSPDFARLLQLQNKESDNLFAELLLKGLPVDSAAGGPLRAADAPLPSTPTPAAPGTAQQAADPTLVGTTRSGARAAVGFARSLGVRVTLVDGSGLDRAHRASPRQLATLLDRLRAGPDFQPFYSSLPIAGRDGTLKDRMRSGPARGHCHAKTGTLTGVSALSGYCSTRGGRMVVFSILMNGVNVFGA